ncbi:type II secretion system F family protein [Nocardioides sp. AX2bis]|uniref:type II secretion system F family protein n=1 Tax=Nocardioides sp. AX2bis TaxID=2653157 RepID=UPI0012EF3AD8|nr:type II secretion system F family protein [Nocardioides sp. AX2bis]VXB72951.1 conserved membrane hypothetical protein [Nocardioides sp. AX2bis]
MRTPSRLLPTVLLGAVVALVATPATATDLGAPVQGAISYVEPGADALSVLVSLPAGADVDLAGAEATVDGVAAEAEASPADEAGGDEGVRRTSVLAIDVSDSMSGDRFAAAQDAARTYLDSVPVDVEVGVVTFAGAVDVALDPTTDRDAARDVVDALTLSRGTLLNEGVRTAVELAGAEGQRSSIVLSDGADTSGTPLEDVVAAVEDSGVHVDVVSLERDDAGAEALQEVATAGRGSVVEATSEALAATFDEQAAVLERQVLVEVVVPAEVTAERATLAVSFPSPTGDVVTSSFVPVRGAVTAPAVTVAEPVVESSLLPQVPAGVLLPAVVLLGLGLLGVAFALVPAAAGAPSAGDRLDRWVVTTRRGGGPAVEEKPAREPMRQQAGAAAAKLLSSTGSLEGRIAHKLERAGSGLKAQEWLVVHAGIALVSAVVGVVLGGPLLLLVGLLLGVLLPWVFLGFKAGRRRKAFDRALPETLQLISGSLSAGLSLAQSIDTVVRDGVEVIATEFKRVLVETRLGVPLEDALDGVAKRYESKDFAWVVMAIRIQRQVGGNLAELLDTVAATMREREYIRRQVSALAAEGKLSAVVLAVLPPGFMLYLLVANREYVMVLFTDPRGLVILIGAAVWLSLGIFWMSKLVKVEV